MDQAEDEVRNLAKKKKTKKQNITKKKINNAPHCNATSMSILAKNLDHSGSQSECSFLKQTSSAMFYVIAYTYHYCSVLL